MKIETEKYLITSDSHNIIVQLKLTRKDSCLLEDKSKIGEVILGEKRFYPTLKSAYRGMVNNMLLVDEDINSFEDIMSLIDKLIDGVDAISCRETAKGMTNNE